jgi:hypothetical protein
MSTAKKTKWCQKCGYLRKDEDTAPESECPKCGVIYAKLQTGATAEARTSLPTAVIYNRKPQAPKPVAAYVIAVLALAGIGYGYVSTTGKPSATTPAAVAAAPVVAPEPPPEPYLENALEYAQSRMSVGLSGEEGGNSFSSRLHVKVVNRGKQEVASLTIRVQGFKGYVMDAATAANKTPEERDIELTGGPYPPDSTREFTMPFPSDLSTILFTPRSPQAEVMNVPVGMPIVRANF